MIRTIEAVSTNTADTSPSTAPSTKNRIGPLSTLFAAPLNLKSGSETPPGFCVPADNSASVQPLSSPTPKPVLGNSPTLLDLHQISNDPQESILQDRIISSELQFSPNRLRSRGSSMSTSGSLISIPSPSGMPLRTPKRLPIFAVSSSLDQHTKEELLEAGFDGWLSKPIDFQRLDIILKGAKCKRSREEGQNRTEDFKAGGWFN
jgi:hypothetical protein